MENASYLMAVHQWFEFPVIVNVIQDRLDWWGDKIQHGIQLFGNCSAITIETIQQHKTLMRRISGGD